MGLACGAAKVKVVISNLTPVKAFTNNTGVTMKNAKYHLQGIQRFIKIDR